MDHRRVGIDHPILTIDQPIAGKSTRHVPRDRANI